jgi:exodeoxyribonuclease VII large subunit
MSQPAFDFGPDPELDGGEGLDGVELDDPTNPTYTVCELADELNRSLRRTFSDGVWVRGEIQQYQESGAGHTYLTLADDTPGQKAVLRVQFFARARARLRPLLAQHRLRLAVGMKVRIFGRLEFYAPGGSIGLTMTDLDPRFTLGDLAQQREQVLRRLVADGSVDANRRRPLSPVPLRIGVVSSAGTAAWHDFHDELQRSGLGFQLVLADTRVQGPTAARRVRRAIEALGAHHRRHGLDAIVVIRGGGARNELAVFDAEPIARAIAAAPVPVLTGLGHEVDRSVADECAHTCYKTPTACAVALVQTVTEYVSVTEQAYAAVLATAAAGLSRAEHQLAERAHRIARRTHAAVERADERLHVRVERLRVRSTRPLAEAERAVQRRADRLTARLPSLLAGEERHLAGLEARVRTLDPAHLLARGWTITRTADGRVVRTPDDVAVGALLTTQLAAGTIASRVVGAGPGGEAIDREGPPTATQGDPT